MNSNLKLILVALTSATLGVVATLFFTAPAQNIQPKLNLTPTEKLNAVEAQLRKPFFVKVEEGKTKIIEAFSFAKPVQNKLYENGSPITSQKDVSFLKDVMDEFTVKTNVNVRKRFKIYDLSKKDPVEETNVDALRNKISTMAELKQLYYKTSFEDEVSKSKTHMFVKFYDCDRPALKSGFGSYCYELQVFYFKKYWSQSSVSSTIEGLYWYKDSPFFYMDLGGLGEFSEDVGSPVALVPIPDESLPIYYIQYNDRKYNWTNTGPIHWAVTDSREMGKFEKWTMQINEEYSFPQHQ